MAYCLWIFDTKTFRQKSIIMQSSAYNSIRCVKWNPIFIDQFVFLAYSSSANSTTDEKTSFIHYYRNDTLEVIEIPAGLLDNFIGY